MTVANDEGPTDSVLTEGLDVETVALSLGIREDVVRKVCYEHGDKIRERMNRIAEDAIFEYAHNDGLIELGEPELSDEALEARRIVAEKMDGRIAFPPDGVTITVQEMIDAGYIPKLEIINPLEVRKIAAYREHRSPATILKYDDIDRSRNRSLEPDTDNT